ncbi:MAG: hypothetical protein ABFR36_09060 [Acidobacteriota bacterium]
MWISKRDTEILAALVNLYSSTRHPVSSAQLAKLLPYSCSLIRKELQKLESNGLITKSSGSSGRTPSDRGLKMFLRNLDRITDPATLSPEFVHSIGRDFSDLSTKSADLLSRESDHIGFVYFDSIFDLEFQKVKLIKIDSYKIMMILSSMNRWVFSKIFITNRNYSESELRSWEQILNKEFSHKSLNRVFKIIRNRLFKDKERYINIYRGIYNLLGTEALMTADLFYNGALNLLNSQVTDTETIKRIIHTLEEKERFAKFLKDILNEKDKNPVIAFGRESGLSEFEELILIISNFYWSENPVGKLGIIGPKFTKYSETINRVKNFSNHFSSILSENSMEA